MNTHVARAAAKRSMSLLTHAARSMEVHPFQRWSIHRSAPADWTAEGKRLSKQAAVFFPGITLLLGWPFVAKTVFDGHV